MKLTKQHRYIALATLLLLGGCKVGQDYTRPATQLPPVYRSGDSLTDSIGLADIPWREFFSDSALVDLMDSALAHNYDLQRALKNIQIANQYVRRSKAAFFPSVEADVAGVNQQRRSEHFYSNPSSGWYGEDGPGENPPDVLFNYQSQYYSVLGTNWEIDIWGKLRRQKEAAVAEYLQTDEARKAVQTSLIAAIADGYYNLLMLDAQMEVAQRNLRLNDSTLRIVKLQYAAGEVTALAIQQTESQMLVAASLIPSLEQEIAVQENTLMALTGRMPDGILRSTSLEGLPTDDAFSVGVPLHLMRNRPDVRAAELALQAANAEVGVAQAFRYPSLSISATVGLNAMMPQNWFNLPGSLIGGFIGGITQPVFSGRRLKTQHEVAKLERDKAELDLHQSVLDATTEVSNALIMVQKLRERYAIAEQRVATAQQAVQSANLLFRSGYASYLEVITAQSNALNSELDLTSIKQRQLNAKVELYRALGGGWK